MADPRENDDLSRLEGSLLDGRYRLEGCLAHPRRVATFRGSEVGSGRAVTIEVTAPEPVPAGAVTHRRATLATGELAHPGVLEVLDIGTTEDGLCWAAMGSAAGEVLAARLARARRLRASDAAEIAIAIGEILDAIHVAGAIHGNLHPARVFVTEHAGRAKVKLALGLPRPALVELHGDERALAIQNEHPEIRWDETVRAVTSPLEYCAPEVLLGREPDARSDVYALGALLYEMLAGATPHDQPTAASQAAAQIALAPAPLGSRVPAGLAAEVLRALSKSPPERHPSAAGFTLALASAITSSSTVPPPPSAGGPPTVSPGRVPPVQIMVAPARSREYLGDRQLDRKLCGSETHELWQTADGHVVVKLPERVATDPEASLAFAKSAETFETLGHPSIARVLDHSTEADGAYVVLDVPHGITLRELSDRLSLPRAAVLRIALDVLDALDAAHGAGTQFGTLDMDSILVCEDGRIVVLPTCGAAPGADPKNDVRALAEMVHEVAGASDTGLPEWLADALSGALAGGMLASALAAELRSADRCAERSEISGLAERARQSPLRVRPAPDSGDRPTPLIDEPHALLEAAASASEADDPTIRLSPRTPPLGTRLDAIEAPPESAPVHITVPRAPAEIDPEPSESIVVRESARAPAPAERAAPEPTVTDRPVSRTHAPDRPEASPGPRRKRSGAPLLVLSVLLAACVLLGVALWPRPEPEPVVASSGPTAPEPMGPTPTTPAPIVPTSTTTVASVMAPPVATFAAPPAQSATPPVEAAPAPARQKPSAAPRSAPAAPSSPRYRIDDLKPLPRRR